MSKKNITTKPETKPESRRSIAKRHGITAITLDAWQAEGLDIYNDAQLAARATMKHGHTTPTMQAAKLRKLLAEARSAELKAMQTEGKMIDLEEHTQAFIKLGHVLKTCLLRLPHDLPPRLLGMSMPEIQKALRESIEAALWQIADKDSPLWKS